MDSVKLFGLQKGLLKDSMDNSLFEKDTWRSNKFLWDPYLRLDELSFAFKYR